MVETDRICAVLQEMRILTAQQCRRALDVADGDLEALLTALGEEPAWWSAEDLTEPFAALTAYQAKVIRRHADSPRRLAANLRMGHYLLLRQIGSGGMGVVYQARDLQENRFVAIKRMKFDSRNLLKRFRKERRVLQRLKHPRIVRLYDTIKGKRSESLVMQYLDGHTLDREMSAKGRVPWRDVIRWGIDLLEALHYLHARKQVIHRDIKPNNILLHQEDAKNPSKRVAVLLDVGLAKSLDAAEDDASASVSIAATRANQVLGTFLYMAPEQWANKPVYASDIYSLGASLFHALTGVPPFDGNDRRSSRAEQPLYIRLCRAHTETPPPHLRDLCSDLPEELDRLVDAMLAKKAEDRLPISLLLAGFRRLLEREPTEPIPVRHARAEQKLSPRRSSSRSPERSPSRSPERSRERTGASRREAVRPTQTAEVDLPLPDEEENSLLGSFGDLLRAFRAYLGRDRQARRSTIFATPEEELRRTWRRFKHQAGAWFLSLGQPTRYPGRVTFAVLLVAACVTGLYWLWW